MKNLIGVGVQMKKYILLLLIFGILGLSACSSKKQENSNDEVKDFCKQYASDYTLVQSKDEMCVVSVEAPDFEKIVQILLEDGQQEINVQLLKKVIENNPDCTKEYLVNVESEDISAIKEAFLGQVSYELMVAAIQDVKYEDKWSVEE